MRSRAAVAIIVLLTFACSTPVSVRRVPARQVTAELARSALNSDRPSLFSENALYRWDLTDLFARDPEAALSALRGRIVDGKAGANAIFALAELCFLHADRSRSRAYYLAAVVYAWAFLFPEDREESREKLDPRARIAADLYNRGLTKAFASNDRTVVDLRPGTYRLPFGQQLWVTLDDASLDWAGRQLGDFVPVAELEVRGLGARFRSPGIGAPLAARMRPTDPTSAGADFVIGDMRVPATALLWIDDPRRQIHETTLRGTLRLYNHYEVEDVEIAGKRIPLEAEPSATLAYSLSSSPSWAWERWGILRGDLVSREVSDRIGFLEPYRPGRIPVVFVYGTASSPGRWANMVNVLSNVRQLRDRYQFWFFFYDTGNAIPYSAMRLRQTLTDVVERVDPEGEDPALEQMVLVGHSQGGLLTRLAAVGSGDRFWEGLSRRPIEDLSVSRRTRDLLREMFFFEPLPFVTRLIFLATPHRGSHAAELRISSWIARFVRLPETVGGAMADLVTGNLDDLRFNPRGSQLGAIYGMHPDSSFLAALAGTTLAPGVTAHSIIPIQGDLPPEGQTDGVVSYASAHFEAAATEVVVPRSGHSVQSNPLAIEEVRRILVEHADDVCRATGRACERP